MRIRGLLINPLPYQSETVDDYEGGFKRAHTLRLAKGAYSGRW